MCLLSVYLCIDTSVTLVFFSALLPGWLVLLISNKLSSNTAAVQALQFPAFELSLTGAFEKTVFDYFVFFLFFLTFF